MDIELKVKQINSILVDYNEIATNEVKAKENFQSQYNETTTNEKLTQWRAEKVNPILKRINYLVSDVSDEIKKESKKIPSIKFPLRFSVSSFDKTLGEIQRTNAFQFYNTVKDKNSILNEIDSAFQTEQTDYANNLIEIIGLNKPDEIAFSSASKEDREFYQAVENRKKEFELKNNITSANESLEKLELIKLELQFILSRIESNDPLIIPIRKFFEIDNRKDRQKFTEENLEALNISNAFFAQHNAIIKYKILEQKGVTL